MTWLSARSSPKGGQAAVDATNDPMIALAKLVDSEARALRKIMTNKGEAEAAVPR
jgi:hypothetical protein